MTPCFRILSRVPVCAAAGIANAKLSPSARRKSFLPIMRTSRKESTRAVFPELRGGCYRVEEQCVLEGLSKVRRGAGGETVVAGLGLVVRGDDDRRKRHPGLLQLLEHVQAGHAGHVQVEDEAVG